MTTIFTPEIIEASIEVKTEKGKRIANMPAANTLLRLTLGQTIIYARVRDHQPESTASHRILYITIEPLTPHAYRGLLDTSIWYEDGWVIEILDDDEAAA